MESFIKKFKQGDAVFRVLGVDNVNRIIDVLVGIRGDGCEIQKPTNAEGRNWKIVLDGKHTDIPNPDMEAATGEDPKPLDYLIRFVADVPRESQYGDFAAQTDFKWVQNASNEWLQATMVPVGYCYLTFTPSGGGTTTSARADGISTGFSLKAARKNAGTMYRLAHGNQYAAMMRQADGDSIQIDVENYAAGPAPILRQWNTDDNYISIPAANITSGSYAFLHYDTYLTPGKTLIQEPHEIKFATLNKYFFEDVVFHVTEILKAVIDDDLCGIVLGPILQVYQWHAMCRGYNNDGIPFAATPGSESDSHHGGWVALSALDGMADFSDLKQLLADTRALYNRVNDSPLDDVEQNIIDFQALKTRIDGLISDAEDYADDMAAWNSALDADLLTLQNAQADIGGLESTATNQEQRVAALKQALGIT
jgi:hypothetical protein